MLGAGRTVVSRHQKDINDANLGDKGFDSKTVLNEAVTIYQETSGVDPMSIDPNSRHGKLIRMQMDAIAEVIDAHQADHQPQGRRLQRLHPGGIRPADQRSPSAAAPLALPR